MTNKLLFSLLSIALIGSSFPPFTAGAQSALPSEDNAGAVLCQPGIYLQSPDDCVPLGPSETLTQMAQLGLEFPLRPLQVASPDPALNDVSSLYYKVNPTTGTGFYPSLGAAVAKSGADRLLSPGRILYVVYSSVIDTGKGIYFQLPSGEYMPGDGSRVSVPVFQGLLVLSTPHNAFGWILSDTPVRREPNLLYSNTAIRTLKRFDRVQVYSVQNIEGDEWYLIGPDEWVEGRMVAAVFPDTNPPAGVTNGRWIDINLAEQTLAVYDNREMVYATIISTGVEPFWTRPGLFQIYKKKELETMSGSFEADHSDYYYLENVPWTMYFDKARALHGAYWHTFFGYPQSHGCVNLSVGDAHWLFNWASEGDWVYVHDPSGLTPTDPAKYGEGGA